LAPKNPKKTRRHDAFSGARLQRVGHFDDRPYRVNELMKEAAAVIEFVGNGTAVVVALLWARVAWRAGIQSGSLLLVSICVWALSNCWYAIAYYNRLQGLGEWFDTNSNQIAETLQQASMVSTPLLAIWVLSALLKGRRRRV
jgi:hypothetical protein